VQERERWFQNELYRIIVDATRDKRYAGLVLGVATDFPVDRRSADVVVFKEPEGIPVLVVETKRKIERRYWYKREFRFDPFGTAVIGQALSYAALIKEKYNLPVTPLFATANRDVVVLFSPVENPWDYLDREAVEEGDYERALKQGAWLPLSHEHYLLHDKRPLREELIQHILDLSAKIWKREVAPERFRRPIRELLIDKLRYFVDSLSLYFVEDPLRRRLSEDEAFRSELDELAKEAGYRNGIFDIVGRGLEHVGILARMMSYVLMNKIIFYKVLERYYTLPELNPILEHNPDISSMDYLNMLNQFFEKAIEITGDFEQIFITGLFDHIVLSEEKDALSEIDDLIRILSLIEIERFGDIIGYVYEELIPADERHQMGQFYTPSPIAELIVRWCVREGSDKVLDPACGSGTFLIEAYWRLKELKTGNKKRIPPSRELHTEILRQLYAIDINPFPTQLTSMNLAMKNVRAPTTEANIQTSDFFALSPPDEKELEREGFDAIVGNPPYTRWTEIPDNVQDKIREKLSDDLSSYGLHADVVRGREPGIYVHFIMWARRFLRPGGRLGMIISDSWLQTDYGVNFGRFLLENFKVKALIDLSARVFPVPLIGACILLLEKPEIEEDVGDNRVVFIYLSIPKGYSINVNELYNIINEPERAPSDYIVRIMRQGDIPRNLKWINLLFNPMDIIDELKDKTVRLDELFEPSRGNTIWSVWAISHGRRPDVGGEAFFYLTKSEAESHGLIPDFVVPLLPSSRYIRFFTFTEYDWKYLRDNDKKCYLFLASAPRSKLPENVVNYIKLGETEIMLRRRRGETERRPVCESLASSVRKKNKEQFADWYDLGGFVECPIYIARGVQYLVRFTLAKFELALDDRILALIPKEGVDLSESEVKALLAFLNSSFGQIQAEILGRITGGGMLELDVRPLRQMLIPNIKELSDDHILQLAELFDKLEKEARRIGGADTKENCEKLYETVIAEIDLKIAEALGLPEVMADMAHKIAKIMMERRLSRAEEARPRALKGAEEPLIVEKAKRKGRRRRRKTESRRLTEFIT